MEDIDFTQPPDYYEKEFHDSLATALVWWESRQNTNEVRIPENGIEEHFEANWGEDDEKYRKEIEDWRPGNSKLTDLTVIRSETSGQTSFIIDTSDLVIGDPNDEFMFHMVQTCWALTMDLNFEDKPMRIAFHLPGIMKEKDIIIQELIKAAKNLGAIESINIFYNGSQYKDGAKGYCEKAIPKDINYSLHDMDSIDHWGAHDLIVKATGAHQYYNCGEYDLEKDKARVSRVYSKNWLLNTTTVAP